MEEVGDWDTYWTRVSAIRRCTQAYTSNLYVSRDQVECWCASGRLKAMVADRAVLFLLSDRDFYHIYHVAEDQGALATALAGLLPETYTSDLVGQGGVLEQLSATYTEAGFTQHNFLRRMILTQPTDVEAEGNAVGTGPEIALPEHVPEIAALLERLLDRFSEQLPDNAELERAARAGQLLFVRRSRAVAGILMYDLKGQLAHLRYWHVDDNVRGEGIGRLLMNAFLSQSAQARRRVLWVMGDNERSIAIYRHYGFEEDGLLDRIMIRRKESVQMTKISDILCQIRPEFDFSQSNSFFDDGILDSFDLITLVSELDQAYGISIDGLDILPTNFCNIAAIEALLARHGVTG